MNAVEPIRDISVIKEMREVLKNKSDRNELLFLLGINVGLRISDIIKLKVSDIYNTTGAKDKITIKEQKTGKTKVFYFNSNMKQIINNYCIDKDLDTYLFKSRKGDGFINRMQAYKIINDAAEYIGIVERRDNKIIKGEIGTHTLRKTFGYHAYKNGTAIELLMEMFNHSSQHTTLRYIGITEGQKKEVYVNLNLGF